jgi:hypothetical protein
MKKQTKSKKKDESKTTGTDDKNQILKEIMFLDDTEIFNNELNTINESLENIKSDSIKNIIYSNFLFNKLEEVEKQLKLAAELLETNPNSKLDKFLNCESAEKTKQIIIEKISKLKENSVNPFNDVLHSEEHTYRLKIFYSDGSDNYPQQIQIKMHKNANFNIFLRELKKVLDIYEFAKFKIVLMVRDYDYKFLENLEELNYKEETCLKIVPLNYEIL